MRAANSGRATNGNVGDRVAKLHRCIDQHSVGLVVLQMIRRDAHAVADKLDRPGELGREEVRQAVRLRPLLTKEVLRTKRGRPVDYEEAK